MCFCTPCVENLGHFGTQIQHTRCAKIRTYNFPQGRVTDHRINLTLYKLNDIMDGDLTEIIEALKLEDQKTAMEAV